MINIDQKAITLAPKVTIHQNKQHISKVIETKYSKRIFYKNGSQKFFDHLGTLISEQLPNGTTIGWYEDGKIQYKRFPNGTFKEWYKSGKLRAERTIEGTTRSLYENGKLRYIEYSDGSYYYDRLSLAIISFKEKLTPKIINITKKIIKNIHI